MRRIVVAVLLVLFCDAKTLTPGARPLTAAVLAMAGSAAGDDTSERGPSRDEASLRQLELIAERVRERARSHPAESAVSGLNAVVFDELGFVREVDDESLEFVLLPSVLRDRRGSCVGLGTLYLALGEALGWTIRGVLMPGHFYVRVDEAGRPRNVELLRRGEEMPDAWYRMRFPIPGRAAAEYEVPLTSAQVVAVVAYDIGNQRRRAGRLVEARRFYDRARVAFPAFAEAHASAALTSHLLGALDDALDAYRAAERANPNLPGLTQNLGVLERELRLRSSSVARP